MSSRSTFHGWFQLERVQRDRLTDELQRVHLHYLQYELNHKCISASRLVELIVLNVGLSAGILSPVRQIFESSFDLY